MKIASSLPPVTCDLCGAVLFEWPKARTLPKKVERVMFHVASESIRLHLAVAHETFA